MKPVSPFCTSTPIQYQNFLKGKDCDAEQATCTLPVLKTLGYTLGEIIFLVYMQPPTLFKIKGSRHVSSVLNV